MLFVPYNYDDCASECVSVHVCESVSVCFDIDELYRAAVKQISFSVTLVFCLSHLFLFQ